MRNESVFTGMSKLAAIAMLCAVALPAAAEPIRTLIIGDCNTSWPDGYGEQLVDADPSIAIRGCGGSTLDVWREGVFWDFGCIQSRYVPVPTHELFTDLIVPLLPVDTVVVMLGSNDAFWEVHPELYRDWLRELVRSLRAAGAARVMLTAPPRCYPPDVPFIFQCTPSRSLHVTSYGPMIDDVCQSEPGAVCGPNLYRLLDRRGDFIGDGIHLSAQGHPQVAEALAQALPEPSGAWLVALATLAALRRNR